MAKLPIEKKKLFESRVNLIKQIVMERSIFKNDRSNVIWSEIDADFTVDGSVLELILYVKFNDQPCDDCSFETEELFSTITRHLDSIYKSLKGIGFDSDLKIIKGNSIRGVNIEHLKYGFGEISFEFGIYIDPD